MSASDRAFSAAAELGDNDDAGTKERTAKDLLRWVLEQLSEMTTGEFARGADLPIRRRIAEHLRLNPDDYCL